MKRKLSQLIEFGYTISLSYGDPRCAEDRPFLVDTYHLVDGKETFCGVTLKEAVNTAYEALILDQ